jgi:hypothetical protein
LSFEFFADRNCGCHQFPAELRRAGIVVHRHRDHFLDDTADDEWLPSVAARGWVAVSFDKRIRKNQLERDAVFLSGARLILLTGGSADAVQLARNFINTFGRIVQFLEREPAPFIARVKRPSPVTDIGRGKPGEIEVVMSEAMWRASYDATR